MRRAHQTAAPKMHRLHGPLETQASGQRVVELVATRSANEILSPAQAGKGVIKFVSLHMPSFRLCLVLPLLDIQRIGEEPAHLTIRGLP